MATRVWDLPTRLSHWTLAAAVATCWWTGEEGIMDVHMISGYVVLGTVVFRVIWGWLGSGTARFRRFPIAPASLRRYLPTLFQRKATPYRGHNPTGALMVVFMLAFFGTQSTLGLFATDEILTEGPMVVHASSDWVDTATDWHHELGEFAPWIVGLHVGAVLFYLLFKRLDLISPMVTGRSKAAGLAAEPEPVWASAGRAWALMICIALAVTVLVQWARGTA